MPGHDIIVIGASAGGVEAVSAVVRGLPRDLPAAVFVVVHFPADSRSVLPQILERAGALPAAHPEDGETIRTGRIYVAPPGRHLLIEDGRIRLVRGPWENGAIPAVDSLFRSAARWHSGRVVGVVLTGTLDDGTAGLIAIKRRHGVTVVQDPAQALYDGMPRSAVENAPVDHVVPLDRIASLLDELARTPPPGGNHPAPYDEPVDHRIRIESDIIAMRPGVMDGDDTPHPGQVSGFTCPECHGALWEIDDEGVVRYRCRVGHGYTVESVLSENGRDVEAALWTGFRALRERAALCRRLGERMAARGQHAMAARQHEEAAETERRAALLRQVLLRVPAEERMASD